MGQQQMADLMSDHQAHDLVVVPDIEDREPGVEHVRDVAWSIDTARGGAKRRGWRSHSGHHVRAQYDDRQTGTRWREPCPRRWRDGRQVTSLTPRDLDADVAVDLCDVSLGADQPADGHISIVVETD